MSKPSYHDLHITTPHIDRVSIFNLPFRVEVRCTRTTGWKVIAHKDGSHDEELLGGEYADKWLILDVDGHVICNSRPEATDGV